MTCDNRPTDGESEACAPIRPGTRLVGAIESFEDMRPIVRMDADARVRDGDRDMISQSAQDDTDGAVVSIVVDSVAEEVGDDLSDSDRVAGTGDWREVEVDGDPAGLAEGLDQVHAFLNGGGEVEGIKEGGLGAGIEAREIEQGFGQLSHALSSALRCGKGFGVIRTIAGIGEAILGVSEQDADGGAEFVCGIGSEAGLLGESRLEAGEGGVEDIGEPAEFIVGVGDIDAARQVAIGDLGCGGTDGLDGLDGALGQPCSACEPD